MKKRLIAILLILALCFATGSAEGLSKEEWYNNGIECLYTYDAESMEQAQRFFTKAGTYKFAQEYTLYADALYSIARAEEGWSLLDDASLSIEILIGDEKFASELEERGLASCENLLRYIEARKDELMGETAEAAALYLEVRILDSLQRSKRLQSSENQNKYEEAMRLFDAGDYITAAQKFDELGTYSNSKQMKEKALAMHVHEWIEATCESPKTCLACGATEGSALGHNWKDATCTEQKTCIRCGMVSGSALGHNWKDATCTTPKTCLRCGVTSGTVSGHDWQEATYTTPKTCRRCGKTEGKPLSKWTVGNTVTFGSYPQTTSGNYKTPIEWQVLAVQGDKALLISKYALDCAQYNNTRHISVTWETCTLRTWLNNDFYNKAFSASDMENIITRMVSPDKNPHYSTNPGDATNDNVFLLSIPEVNKYFKDDASRKCAPTDYAVKNGAYTSSSNKVDGRACCWWWLRSPGNRGYSAAGVYDDGSVDDYGNYVNIPSTCVRPCVWVRLF